MLPRLGYEITSMLSDPNLARLLLTVLFHIIFLRRYQLSTFAIQLWIYLKR